MTNLYFPKDFWWGAAASGPQTEGRTADDGKGDSIWDYWYATEPERFYQKRGPKDTVQLLQRYPEDVALMKEIGFNSFRTSIQWSRLLPEGRGAVNQQAVAFYREYFATLIGNGIEPFINLYHFDMPMALQKEGGWLNRETVTAFADYAALCFELFGDQVRYWFTQNEPIVPVEMGYLYQQHYPAEINLAHAVQVGYHEALASALAIQRFRQSQQSGEIGIILNLTPTYPKDPNDEKDVQAAQLADAFFNRSFLDPAVKGTFPVELIAVLNELAIMPETRAEDLQIIRENTVDLLGVNYYQPRRVQQKRSAKTADTPMPEDYFDVYDWPEKKINPHRGWEIYERGIYDTLINLRDNYGNIPCYISENGMGVEDETRFIDASGQIQDEYRITFIKDHLRYVHQAIQEGSQCRGYHMWTCMDNWSWLNEFKNRYGFIAVDLATQKRTIKKSGEWFHEVILQNGFVD